MKEKLINHADEMAFMAYDAGVIFSRVLVRKWEEGREEKMDVTMKQNIFSFHFHIVIVHSIQLLEVTVTPYVPMTW